MKIKRFYSKNVRSALKQVVEHFGEDAAILSNKKVADGVEIVAALDYDESLLNQYKTQLRTTQSQSRQSRNTHSNNSIDSNNSQIKNEQSPLKTSQTRLEDSIASIQIQDFNDNNASDQITKKEPVEYGHSNIEWSLDPSLQAMKQELELMRGMMSEQLKGLAWHQFGEQNPLQAMLIRRFSKLGLTTDVIENLLPYVNKETDAEKSWQKLLAIFTKQIPIAENQLMNEGGIYALVGPAGVGKTTTIAKIAARFVMRHGVDSVALISTDNYRISAQEQLSTFAKILKIPSVRVSKKASLESLLESYASKKLILIDTAGMSSRDPLLIKQLDMLNDCKQLINKLFLMSASNQADVLKHSLDLFSYCRPDYAVITKLDEATSLGELLSVVMASQLPLFYTTDGQKVPDDIRIARGHHLVSKAVNLASKYERVTDEWHMAQHIQQAKSA